MACTSSDTTAYLLAALYLEAVLPVIAPLAGRDAVMAATLGGADFAVHFSAPSALRARISVQANGVIAVSGPAAQVCAGDIRLWFPTVGQAVRALDGGNRFALALPLGGWARLACLRRFSAAGRRLEFLLNSRPAVGDPALALHAWGNLAVGLAAANVWLRHHPEGPATRALLGSGIVVFSCPAFHTPLWIDLTTLTSGGGPPPATGTLMAEITFADLDTLLAELDERLDAPAALGLGSLRLAGYVPLAENLGILLARVGALLKPAPVR
jgi:hypothetical protein